MTLTDAIFDNRVQSDLTVFARKPWNRTSECTLLGDEETSRLSPERTRIESEGYQYFLEISIIREILEDHQESELTAWSHPSPAIRKALESDQALNDFQFEIVVYYAENDSFPDLGLR